MLADIKSVLLKLVIVALVLAAGYIAWDTIQDRNAEVKRLATQVESKKQEIATLEQDLENKNTLEKKQQEVEQAKLETEEKVVEKQSEAKQYVVKKIEEIESKYKDLPDTAETQRKKEVEYSLERMRGLWATYCIQMPEDPLCVK